MTNAPERPPTPAAMQVLPSDETAHFGSTSEALKIPAYRRLLTAWTIGNVGDSALFLTIGIWVKTLTGSDVFAASVFILVGIPALFAPLFGLMADKLSRKRLVIVTDTAIALVVLSLLFVKDPSDLWLIYAATLLYSMATYVNAAAQSGLLRDTLPEHLLAPANGLFGSIDQGLRIIAPLAAAGAFALWGIEPILIITALTFLGSAAFMASLPITETRNDVSSQEHWLRTAVAGFHEIYTRKRLWRFTIALTFIVAAGGALNALIFPILDTGLGLRPEMLSVFISIQGVFAVIAGLNASRILKRFGYTTTMAIGVAGFVISFAALAIPNAIAVAAAISLLGMSMPLVMVATITLRQLELPLNMQGRGGAAMNVLFNVPQVLISAATAALLGVISYPWIIAVATVIAACGFFPLLAQKRATF
ncbi:MFS transporter [Timonella sp. A28]|uniref:MFS transporter n=1 Tax=Timonella sp. A28 TaxID=3442640 RepID=UPI003EB860D6